MTIATAPRAHDDSAKAARLSGPAFALFLEIARLWQIAPPEARVLLGGLPESTYFKYQKAPQTARLSHDTLARISHLLGIFKAVNLLLPRAESADAWLRRPNDAPLFKGRSALDYMLGGEFEDIAAVRRYLDAQRGW
ncbi:MAG TPA: MbcA/ParS/Xre antitoxin family protein [Candidatus Lustribacter sp.]